MVEKIAKVRNAHGIHCRPSSVIYKACEGYGGAITLSAKGQTVSFVSIMDLIGLGLFMGDKVVIRVTGQNEEATCAMLVELFQKKFDFPPRVNEDTDSKAAGEFMQNL